MNELGTMVQHPEYFHVLLNPIPIYVMALGVAVLVASLMRKSREIQLVGLWIVAFAGVSAWPTWYFGHQAYHHLYESLTEEGQRWADTHMQRADISVYVLYVTAVLALAAIFLPRKFPRTAKMLPVLTTAVALVTVGLDLWVGKAGGQIRHSEFRFDSPPERMQKEHEH